MTHFTTFADDFRRLLPGFEVDQLGRGVYLLTSAEGVEVEANLQKRGNFYRAEISLGFGGGWVRLRPVETMGEPGYVVKVAAAYVAELADFVTRAATVEALPALAAAVNNRNRWAECLAACGELSEEDAPAFCTFVGDGMSPAEALDAARFVS